MSTLTLPLSHHTTNRRRRRHRCHRYDHHRPLRTAGVAPRPGSGGCGVRGRAAGGEPHAPIPSHPRSSFRGMLGTPRHAWYSPCMPAALPLIPSSTGQTSFPPARHFPCEPIIIIFVFSGAFFGFWHRALLLFFSSSSLHTAKSRSFCSHPWLLQSNPVHLPSRHI